MRIPEKYIEEYMVLYKKRFGKEISYQKALEDGTKLLNLMKLIYKPISKKDYEKYSKYSREAN